MRMHPAEKMQQNLIGIVIGITSALMAAFIILAQGANL